MCLGSQTLLNSAVVCESSWCRYMSTTHSRYDQYCISHVQKL